MKSIRMNIPQPYMNYLTEQSVASTALRQQMRPRTGLQQRSHKNLALIQKEYYAVQDSGKNLQSCQAQRLICTDYTSYSSLKAQRRQTSHGSNIGSSIPQSKKRNKLNQSTLVQGKKNFNSRNTTDSNLHKFTIDIQGKPIDIQSMAKKEKVKKSMQPSLDRKSRVKSSLKKLVKVKE